MQPKTHCERCKTIISTSSKGQNGGNVRNPPYHRTFQTIEEEYLRSGKGLTLICTNDSDIMILSAGSGNARVMMVSEDKKRDCSHY